MLKKLTSILLFSQAAIEATIINKDNYAKHLCDDNLFKATPDTKPAPPDPMYKIIHPFMINMHHDVYCDARFDYEEALKLKNPFSSYPAKQKEVTGIAYANACEKLKDDRENLNHAWNTLAPTLPTCNNKRRRTV